MKDDDYSYENLKNLKYIDWIMKEVTRYYGPINLNFLRINNSDFILKGVPIKKNTGFGVQHLGLHFSEEYYKNPTQFRPERWEEECNNVPTYAIGGFSGGPRTCIGKNLARLNAKIGLIKFMKRYEKVELETKDLELYFRLVYQPKSYKTKLTKVSKND